jgi:hypothetical protein
MANHRKKQLSTGGDNNAELPDIRCKQAEQSLHSADSP